MPITELLSPLAGQRKRLSKVYSQNAETASQAGALASILAGLTLIISSFAVVTITTDILDERAKSFFVPYEIAILVILGAAYMLLLKGYFRVIRTAFTLFTVLTVIIAIAVTGGFPNSVASPCIIFLPVIIYFLHGRRLGHYFAVLVPLLVCFQWVLTALGLVSFPDFTSTSNPEVNLVMVVAITYIITVFVVASYEHNNSTLVSDLRAERRLLAEAAFRDPLTGLFNTRGFNEDAAKRFKVARQRNLRLSVLFIDLNDFKSINDKCGHEVGDWVLKITAKRLMHVIRQQDLVARIGGDEFAILLSQHGSQRCMSEIIARIRSSIMQPIEHAGSTHFVGASIGVSDFPDDGEDLPTLLRTADAAMYSEKAAKRKQQKPNQSWKP